MSAAIHTTHGNDMPACTELTCMNFSDFQVTGRKFLSLFVAISDPASLLYMFLSLKLVILAKKPPSVGETLK